jgi:hypothetical protein
MYADQDVRGSRCTRIEMLGSICTRINMYSGQEIKMYSVPNILGSRYVRNQDVLGPIDQHVLGSSDQYVLIYTRINMYAYQYFLCLRASGEPSLVSPLRARLVERMFRGSWHSFTYFAGRIPILYFCWSSRFALCSGRIPALCLRASGEPTLASPLSARLLEPDVCREFALMHLFLR